MWGYKVVVPTKLLSYLIKDLHDSHLGIVKMKIVPRKFFGRNYVWWPNIDTYQQLLFQSFRES